MKKILVPTDFSRPAHWAAEVATDIARKAGAQIVLLHIVEQPTKESFSVTGQVADLSAWEDKLFTHKLIDRNKKQLQEQVEKIEMKGVKVIAELRMGNPFHGIHSVITAKKVDLVVMGTNSRSKLEEVIVGSNTEKVVRHSRCPVLTIHQKPSTREFRNIVYASSLSEDEKAFAGVIKNTQEMYGARIHLVRINTPMNFKPDNQVKAAMERFVSKVALKNYTLNVFNHYSEEEGILHFARAIDADLIGMATHGRTGFAHVLAGSIAEDVVNHGERPVLTYVTRHN